MSDMRYVYFFASGKSYEIVQQFVAKYDAQYAAMWSLAKELGASQLMIRGTLLEGFLFDQDLDAVPNGLRIKEMDGHEVYLPNKRVKAGKVLAEKMKGTRLPSMDDLGSSLKIPVVTVRMANGAFTMTRPYIESFNDAWVIRIPIGIAEPYVEITEVLDAWQLRDSDYWKLVEAREQGRAVNRIPESVQRALDDLTASLEAREGSSDVSVISKGS